MDKTIFFGERGEKFRTLIQDILKKGKLAQEYIDLITDEEGMKLYSKAFTHSSVDEKNNYEVLEFLGDSTVNNSVVWYLFRRFPQLNCPEGVKVLARLKINLVSKERYYRFASGLDFWNYISAEALARSTKRKSLMEDVFEAFFGATEKLLDEQIRPGVGHHICYNIVSSIYDDLKISLRYQDLFDAKTRLKEIGDAFQEIGRLKYMSEKKEKLQYVKIYRDKELLGEGVASIKPDAEQKAATEAIFRLEKQGFSKPIPEFYQQFC